MVVLLLTMSLEDPPIAIVNLPPPASPVTVWWPPLPPGELGNWPATGGYRTGTGGDGVIQAGCDDGSLSLVWMLLPPAGVVMSLPRPPIHRAGWRAGYPELSKRLAMPLPSVTFRPASATASAATLPTPGTYRCVPQVARAVGARDVGHCTAG